MCVLSLVAACGLRCGAYGAGRSWEQRLCWTARAQADGTTAPGLTLLVAGCAHQAQDFFCSKTELGHVVTDETSGTWGSLLFLLQ